MDTKILQTSFNQGVLSPEMSGRTDLNVYYSAASVINNGMVMPQGGVSKRNGFKHLIDIPSTGTVYSQARVFNTNGDVVKVMHMTVSIDESYLLVKTMNGYGVAVNTRTYEQYQIPFSRYAPLGTDIEDIQYVQSGGDIIYVHPLYPPMGIERKVDTNGNKYFVHTPFEFKSQPQVTWAGSKAGLRELANEVIIRFADFVNGDKFNLATLSLDTNNTITFTEEVSYNVVNIPITDTTVSGSFVGDDVSAMLAVLNSTTSGMVSWLYEAVYETEPKQQYVKVNGIITKLDVINRKFVGIRAYRRYSDDEVLRLYCLTKSTNTGSISISPTAQEVVGNTSYNAYRIDAENTKDGDTITFSIVEPKKEVNAVISIKYTTTLGETDEDATQAAANISSALDNLYTVTPIYQVNEEVKQGLGVVAILVKWNVLLGFTLEAKTTGTNYDVSIFKTSGSISATMAATGNDNAGIKEEAFNAIRGYPATVITHGSRLVFGGSYSQPQTLFMSKVGLYNEFEIVQQTDSDGNPIAPLATDPIMLTLSTKVNTPITALSSGKRLLVFTATSAHLVEGNSDTGGIITPTSASSLSITSFGSRFIQPEEFDGSVYFLQYSGASLNSTTYDFSSDSFVSTDNSLFSKHLIVDPQDLTLVQSDNQYGITYMAVLNKDGTIAYYSSLLAQDLRNWTLLTTDGKFIAIQGVEDKLFTITRRGDGNTHTMLSIEVMEEGNVYCDGSREVLLNQGTILGNLEDYQGKDISILADGYPLTLTVGSGLDYVELPFPADAVTYGLPIPFEVTTMPLNINLNTGAIVHSKKRVVNAKVDLLNSMDVSVSYNGKAYKIENRTNSFVMDAPPEPLTGIFYKTFLGWSEKATVSVLSTEAVPVTLLTLECKVTVAGR